MAPNSSEDTRQTVNKSDYDKLIHKLVAEEKERTWGPHDRYLQNHLPRFEYTVDLCRSLDDSKTARVLDVGRSELTLMLAGVYEQVSSLGFPLEEDRGAHRETGRSGDIPHIEYDLTRAKDTDSWPDHPGTFDLIVYSETIEHIHTAPEFTLLMLRYLLSENGKIIVTTPNALSIHKRLRLLLGMHPFEKIRYFEQNPGHFREYTLQELREMGMKARLGTYSSALINFNPLNPFSSLKALKYLPLKPFELWPSFRDNIVIVYRKI